MNLDDYRLLSEVAYGEWKRCHSLYLNLACQIAGGVQFPPETIAAVLVNVERAMADLASLDHQSTVQGTIGTVRADVERSQAEFVSISRQSTQPSPSQAA